ncbi:MAG: glycerol-3-phosphate 1-O-acyltransferase PlsY, partial [Clostridia bacterium]|nr:glycerol-3-phosphate 1-O-acyltransferase PlsY [Clostridia bacterium]
MNVLLCILLGYLLGSLNPAALIGKIKRFNLRKHGTGNLGATNVLLNFGKGFAAVVMLFDVFKGFAAFHLAAIFCGEFEIAPYLAGAAAILGHIFPFYLHFKGGKGLASFGGFVLAVDPKVFCFLLVTGVIAMLVVNYSVALPYFAGIAFPVFLWILKKSLPVIAVCTSVSGLILYKHKGNLKKAMDGTDNKIREYVATKLF